VLRDRRFALKLTPASVLLVATVVAIAAASALGSGCSVARDSSAAPPTYDESVGALLAQRCLACHGATPQVPAGGWRASSYLAAIGCVSGGGGATLPADESAPMVRVLGDATHAALLSSGERDTLVAWVKSSAPKFQGTVHAPSFVDPRSDQSHGRILRAQQWKPMLDPNDAESCGRCHDGAPARPAGVTSSAPGAPACTTCHQEPGGALGCNTCHGQGTGESTGLSTGAGAAVASSPLKSYPPRDLCFFPGDAVIAIAHAPHVDSTATHANGVACSTCHPIPGNPVIGGTHGNGVVDVKLDTAIAGSGASFDASSQVCTTACHARPGGARPRPAWTETTPMKCGDCHGSPPPQHLSGACTSCHREANATGTGFITRATLHINGRVDLGDGSGKCGACHGRGDDPWPSTNAHPKHQNPEAAAAAPCASCHVVPTTFGAGTSHPRGGPPIVAFSGIAVTRGSAASFTNGSCQNVYCHGAGLEGTTPATPSWTDTTGNASKCGACHGIPPAAPHTGSAGACDFCHRDASVTAAGPGIVPALAAWHVNGVVDRGDGD
jgi:predicted CxxxxCH...CXXCH cytochrome family protein